MNIKKFYPTIVLITAALFFAYDIVADLAADGEALPHIIVEGIVFVALITILVREFHHLSLLKLKLSEEKGRTARLSGELLAVMHSQFSQWDLSPSESEVALLLIKGLSMKEIAEARHVKEKTVRQQATGIYAKSGYAGRHELVAHFIEDLMTDRTEEKRA